MYANTCTVLISYIVICKFSVIRHSTGKKTSLEQIWFPATLVSLTQIIYFATWWTFCFQIYYHLYQIDLTPIWGYHVLGFPARFTDATGVNPSTRARRVRRHVVRRRSEVSCNSRNTFDVLTKLCRAFFKLSLYDVRLSLRMNTSIVCRVCTAWYYYRLQICSDHSAKIALKNAFHCWIKCINTGLIHITVCLSRQCIFVSRGNAFSLVFVSISEYFTDVW